MTKFSLIALQSRKCSAKNIKNVKRDIENTINNIDVLKTSEEARELGIDFSSLKFERCEYKAANGQIYTKFLLNFDAFMLVTMGYTTQRAMLVKVRYINEFNHMKEALQQQKRQSFQPKTQAEMLLLYAQQMVEIERQNAIRDKKIKALENGVQTLTTNLTAVPDHTKVVELVNEYARWTRMGHNEVYNSIYKIMQAQYGIDVRARVENERQRINEEHYRKTGRYYAESTLKKKVNGIDIMVRMGCLDKFHKILVGLLAKAKGVAQ